MKTAKQKTKKILGHVGLGVLGLLILLVVLLNSSFLQTKLANYFLKQQAKAMGITVSVRSVDVGLLSRNVRLTGFEVYDHHKNLLVDIGSMRTSIRNFSASSLRFGVTNISDITFRLHHYQGDSLNNLQQIIDFFKATPSPDKPEFTLGFTSCFLHNGDFSYINEYRSQGDTFQFMDFGNISLSKINFAMKNVDVVGDNVLATIDKFSFKEKKGLDVLKFSTRLNLSGT
ncbi:MAG: hypothetical protein LBP96_00520, partial [Bacteroidales bacterium]|nr:hypothetical protein [Bacteroidales bacterium]